MLADALLDILRCPRSGHRLAVEGEDLVAGDHRYPIVEGVPVFIDAGRSVHRMPKDHVSNPVSPDVIPLLQDGSKRVLNLGAGASKTKYPNVVELEHQIFSTTDVVGDAHCLPFADGVFDTVIAMNVFEHLHAPHVAAAEIHRVLRPGGRVVIHTAFLQPLHEAPHHYYNATEFGVRNWFKAFDVECCRASPNFSPAYTLAFTLSNLLWIVQQHAGTEGAGKVGASTLADWAAAWSDPAKCDTAAWKILADLPVAAQSAVAAGFELLATKRSARPPSSE